MARFIFNERELRDLLEDEDGPVGRYLARCGEIVTQGAKRRAPVSRRGSLGRSPGYLRSKIHWKFGRDQLGMYVDILSPALTPQGAPYGLFMEVGTRPHKIYPRPPRTMLRWIAEDGTPRWAREVKHPGTKPMPYLRPALDDLRGA